MTTGSTLEYSTQYLLLDDADLHITLYSHWEAHPSPDSRVITLPPTSATSTLKITMRNSEASDQGSFCSITPVDAKLALLKRFNALLKTYSSDDFFITSAAVEDDFPMQEFASFITALKSTPPESQTTDFHVSLLEFASTHCHSSSSLSLLTHHLCQSLTHPTDPLKPYLLRTVQTSNPTPLSSLITDIYKAS